MIDRLCAQPASSSPWRTEVKHSYIGERGKPYRFTLATCSTSVRNGLHFAWHHSLQLTPWGGMLNSTRVLLWSYLGSLYQRVFEFPPDTIGEGVRRRGCLAVLAKLRQLFLQKMLSRVRNMLCDHRGTWQTVRITLILGFCLFPVLQQQGTMKSLPKPRGLHASESGCCWFFSISDLNWFG